MVKNKGRKIQPNRPQRQRPPSQQRRPAVPPSDRQRVMERDRRQQAIRRRKQKKKRKIIFYTTFLLVLIATGIVLSLTVFFKIQNITVVGKTPYKEEDIIRVSDIKKGENMFLLGRKKISQKICTSFPYIGKAEIKFELPDGIKIVVTKTSEKQVYKNGEKFVLTNQNGKVLKIVKGEFDKNLMQIKGANIEQASIGQNVTFKDNAKRGIISDISNGLHENGIKDITIIDVSSKSEISLEYQNRIEILFGSCENVKKKMEFLKKVIEKENQRSTDQKGVIDLQYINSDDNKNEKVYFRSQESTTEEKNESISTPKQDKQSIIENQQVTQTQQVVGSQTQTQTTKPQQQ